MAVLATIGAIVLLIILVSCSEDGFGVIINPLSIIFYLYLIDYLPHTTNFILNNTGITFMYCTLYLIAGVVWSFYKYFLFIRKWIYIVKDNPNYVDKEAYVRDVTSIQYNIGKISSWIVNWPFSIIYYVFNNLIKDCIEFIIEHFSFVYNYILEFTLKGLK